MVGTWALLTKFWAAPPHTVRLNKTYHGALPVDGEQAGRALQLDGPVPKMVRRYLKPKQKV